MDSSDVAQIVKAAVNQTRRELRTELWGEIDRLDGEITAATKMTRWERQIRGEMQHG